METNGAKATAERDSAATDATRDQGTSRRSAEGPSDEPARPSDGKPADTAVSGEAASGEAASREAEHEPPVRKASTWTIVVAGVVAACAFVGLFLLGALPRRERLDELSSDTESRDLRPIVETAKPKRGASAFDLRLPAEVASMQKTAVFARANGYLKRLLVDTGDRVAAGDLLAEIDTPEVDAQLAQAKAAVGLAQANVARAKVDLDFADSTLKRYTGFAESGGVTVQQLDEKRSALDQAKSASSAAEAAVAVAEADVRRLSVLQGFEKVVAPFDGIVTARNYDLGALLGGSGGQEMFRLERTDVLRVYVDVPQAYVAAAKTGMPAFLNVRNQPGKEFKGTIVRTAGVLDPTTRTLRCEVDVGNADGRLFSGMFGEVRLPVNPERPPLVVPTSALTFGGAGTKVWVVADGRARSKTVELGRDFGTQIEVVGGLEDDDAVITNPGERLVEDVVVRREKKKAPSAGAAPSAPAAAGSKPVLSAPDAPKPDRNEENHGTNR